MAEQAYAYVTLIPVAKGFQNAIAKEMGGANGAAKTAGSAAGESFTSGFGNLLKRGAMAASVTAALGAAAGAAFLKSSIKGASDLGESINAVQKAYGDYAADVLKLGDGVASRLGLTTTDFNASAVRFSAFAERVVGQGGDVAGFVDGITTRAADFASVFNIDVSEALQVFQSGLAGEAEPLKRFGINLLESEVSAYALANGIGESGRALTETEKVQARYGLLLQSTAKTQGDFADTSDGLANSQRILKATVKGLQTEIGKGLTPVMATITSALVPLAEYLFPKIADFMNNKVAPAADKLAQNFKRLVVQFTTGYREFGNFGDSIKNFFMGGGIEDLFRSISGLRVKFLNAIMDALPGIIDAIVEFLPVFLDFLLNEFIPQVIEQFVGMVKQLVTLAKELIPKLVDAFIEMLPDLIDGAIDLFLSIIDALLEVTPDIITAVIELIPKIVEALIEAIPQLVAGTIELIKGIAAALIDNGPEIIGSALKAVWETALKSVGINPDFEVTTSLGGLSPYLTNPVTNYAPGGGMSSSSFTYNAAPNQSLDSQRDLNDAMRKARLLSW